MTENEFNNNIQAYSNKKSADNNQIFTFLDNNSIQIKNQNSNIKTICNSNSNTNNNNNNIYNSTNINNSNVNVNSNINAFSTPIRKKSFDPQSN